MIGEKKMRLIDVEDEVLKKNLFMKQLEGGLSAKRAIRLFMNQPTVEAIPIEWIRNHYEVGNIEQNKALDDLISIWREENERNNL